MSTSAPIPQQEKLSPPYSLALNLIDKAHNDDPQNLELIYANNVEHYARILSSPKPLTPIQTLAARCQHLRRFDTPRSSYPANKPGYLKWRRDLYTIQADLAVNLCSSVGISEHECRELHDAVSKKDLLNREKCGETTALLEDAAVLTFLKEELEGFKGDHDEISEEKWEGIIRKTWRKLTERGKEEAKRLLGDMQPELVDLITKALSVQVEDKEKVKEG